MAIARHLRRVSNVLLGSSSTAATSYVALVLTAAGWEEQQVVDLTGRAAYTSDGRANDAAMLFA